MIVKFKTVALPTGETLTYWRSEGGTCTVDVQFEKDGPIAISVTSGSYEDALLTLAARFKMLSIETENLADHARNTQHRPEVKA